MIFVTIWDAGCGREWRGVGDDTEVAVQDACVLGAVSLKRKCSQLSVLLWNIAGKGLKLPGNVHRRALIVEGLDGP